MPTITFEVNLETADLYSCKQPYNLSTEGSNFSATRSTWFPDFIRDNRELQDGDQFTVSGANAIYLRDNFTSGEFKFLDVIEETSP